MAPFTVYESDVPPPYYNGPRTFWREHYKITEKITKAGKYRRESLYFPVVPLKAQAQRVSELHQHHDSEMRELKGHFTKKSKNGRPLINKKTGQYAFTDPMWQELYETNLEDDKKLPVLTA